MDMNEFTGYIEQCENKINDIKKKCDEAERKTIELQTDLKNLNKQKEEAIAACESFTGMKFEEAVKVYPAKQQELEQIMQAVDALIDIDSAKETEEDIKKLEELVNNFSMKG